MAQNKNFSAESLAQLAQEAAAQGKDPQEAVAEAVEATLEQAFFEKVLTSFTLPAPLSLSRRGMILFSQCSKSTGRRPIPRSSHRSAPSESGRPHESEEKRTHPTAPESKPSSDDWQRKQALGLDSAGRVTDLP